MKKVLTITFIFILFLCVTCFAEESKVYTNQDLGEYKTGTEESAYQYNQRVLQDTRQKQMKYEDNERDKLNRKKQVERSEEFIRNLERQAEINRIQREEQFKEEEKQRKRERMEKARRDSQQWDIQRKLDEILMWQQIKR